MDHRPVGELTSRLPLLYPLSFLPQTRHVSCIPVCREFCRIVLLEEQFRNSLRTRRNLPLGDHRLKDARLAVEHRVRAKRHGLLSLP